VVVRGSGDGRVLTLRRRLILACPILLEKREEAICSCHLHTFTSDIGLRHYFWLMDM